MRLGRSARKTAHDRDLPTRDGAEVLGAARHRALVIKRKLRRRGGDAIDRIEEVAQRALDNGHQLNS